MRTPAALLTSSLLAVTSALALLPAQQREPVRGTVTRDEQPWADARVELVSWPLPGDDRFGAADVLHATTDAKGRFATTLLPARRYLAWASAELPDGTYVASFAAADVRAGAPLELFADAPRPHTRVKIEGLDAWRPHGAITCTLLLRSGVLLALPCVETDGQLQLPAFPARRAGLELRCGGRPLLPWPAQLDLTQQQAKVTVSPPRAVRFRCVDATGKPLAGAAFFATDLNGRHAAAEIARSDADGMLLPLLPLPAGKRFHWANYPAMLQAPGHAPRSWIGTLKIPADHDGTTAGPVQTFTLQTGRLLHGRLVIGDTNITAGTLRVVSSMATVDGEQGTHEVSRCQALAADGSFAVDVDPQQAAVVTAFLPEAVLTRLPHTTGFPLHPELLLAAHQEGAPDGGAALPEHIDLRQFAALDVQVLAADGAPTGAAQVGLAMRGGPPALVATTDRSGRVRILLPKQLQLQLCCWSPSGFVAIDLDTGTLVDPLRLRLLACKPLPGRVVDRQGNGVAWANVVFFVTSEGDRSIVALAHCLGHYVDARTGADGRFELPLYPGLQYSLSRVMTAGDDHYLKEIGFTAGVDEPEQLSIDLSARR